MKKLILLLLLPINLYGQGELETLISDKNQNILIFNDNDFWCGSGGNSNRNLIYFNSTGLSEVYNIGNTEFIDIDTTDFNSNGVSEIHLESSDNYNCNNSINTFRIISFEGGVKEVFSITGYSRLYHNENKKTYNFIFSIIEEGESKYDPHRYKILTYKKLDESYLGYVLTKTQKTLNKFDDWSDNGWERIIESPKEVYYQERVLYNELITTGSNESLKVYYQGELFNGICYENYPDGNKKLELYFIDGKMNGLSRGWYRNGQIERMDNFINNVRVGVGEEWYESGQIQNKETFEGGKIVEKKYFNNSGDLINIKFY